MTNIADQDYWNRTFSGMQMAVAGPADPVRLWIQRHFSYSEAGGSCIEIGCYPGRYLSIFGELGYELNGVDLSKDLGNVSPWLESLNFRTGTFWNEDFSEFQPAQQFDIVASFGFIEHFTNWKEVLEKHMSMVKDGGFLVMEAPNFLGGIQHWIHSRFDKENFARHHVPAMDVDEWAEIIKGGGFELIDQGYFDGFYFWVGDGKRSMLEKCFINILKGLNRPLGALLPKNRKMYSPFGGVIARKVPQK